MLEDRKQRIKSLVEAGTGVLEHYHQLSATGKLTDKDARDTALDALRYMRYEGGNYLFVFDPEGLFYLMPATRDFEGTNKIDLKDANGKYLIRELISVAKAGGGYVAYDFPKPGTQAASPKIGHAVLFAPWNLVIGTGIYIDDVDVVFRRVLIQLGIDFTGLAGAIDGHGLGDLAFDFGPAQYGRRGPAAWQQATSTSSSTPPGAMKPGPCFVP
jgi:methyl-accepting chemotaxis protein